MGTGKKPAQAFPALGQTWIWWQQQSRFCKVGEKEVVGVIWSQGWGQFRKDWKGTAAF